MSRLPRKHRSSVSRNRRKDNRSKRPQTAAWSTSCIGQRAYGIRNIYQRRHFGTTEVPVVVVVMWATSTVEVTRTSTTLWPHQTHTYDRTIIKRACSVMIHSQCAHKGDCYGSHGRSTPNWRTVIDCGSIVVLCVPPTTRARAPFSLFTAKMLIFETIAICFLTNGSETITRTISFAWECLLTPCVCVWLAAPVRTRVYPIVLYRNETNRGRFQETHVHVFRLVTFRKVIFVSRRCFEAVGRSVRL